MSKIFTLELRRQLPPYLLCLLGVAGLGVYRVVSRSSEVSAFFIGIFVMLTTSTLVVGSVYRLCSYWLYGRDQLLHLPPLRAPNILLIKCGASGLLLFGYFLCYSLVAESRFVVGDLVLSAVTKIVSLVTFFAVVCGVLAVVKRAFRPSLAVVVGIALYVAVTVTIAVVWWRLTALPGDEWGLGVDTDFGGFVSYVNVIPIITFSNAGSGPVGHPQVVAAAFNLGVAALVGGLGLITAKNVRYNFAEVAA